MVKEDAGLGHLWQPDQMKLTFTLFLSATLIALPFSSADAATAVQWNSQTKIDGEVTIPFGTVVTVAPGTKITVGAGGKIIVLGELRAPQGLTIIGSNWEGLVISGIAVLNDFVEKGARQSLYVTSGGSLKIIGGDISGVNGPSQIDGTFTAKNLRYDKGSGDGFISVKETGVISVDGGKFLGSARGAGDFFSFSAGQELTVMNSSITKVHCAFHITGIKNMYLDSVVIENNAYGFMMYGSAESGIKTIKNTTITNNDFGFDEGSSFTKNGNINISNSYIKNNKKDLGLFTKKVAISSPSSRALHPRQKSAP